MIDESEIQAAFDTLGQAHLAAEARAKHDYLENRRKAILADIVKELTSNGMSAAQAREIAPGDERYTTHLKLLYDWSYKDYAWRNRRETALAVIDGWRTYEASSRGRDRIG